MRYMLSVHFWQGRVFKTFHIAGPMTLEEMALMLRYSAKDDNAVGLNVTSVQLDVSNVDSIKIVFEEVPE